MKKVYVAGAYSANNVLDVLKNIGKGERLASDIFKLGFAPFCPMFDKEFIIRDPDFDYTIEMFYEYSIAWLLVSDCILLIPGWQNSKGTLEEIRIAESKGIPIFEKLEEIIKWDYATKEQLC
jgi:hypothetical protein